METFLTLLIDYDGFYDGIGDNLMNFRLVVKKQTGVCIVLMLFYSDSDEHCLVSLKLNEVYKGF